MTDDRAFDRQVERNLKARDLEKVGKIAAAITLYEKNVAEGFEGSGPYDRLAILYRKQGDRDKEVLVLTTATRVFSELPDTRPDKLSKLEKFAARLHKLKGN